MGVNGPSTLLCSHGTPLGAAFRLAISQSTQSGVSSFSGLPIADVLTLTFGNRLVKQPDDVITREVEATHRLRRRAIVTGNDCIAIEMNEVFVFWSFIVFVQLEFPFEAQNHRSH